jgi:hypothetical protein
MHAVEKPLYVTETLPSIRFKTIFIADDLYSYFAARFREIASDDEP